MKDVQSVFERIDDEIGQLKEAQNSNVDELKRILNRQAEAITILVGRVKELESQLNVEKTWDEDLEEVVKLIALDESKIWKFRKHKGVYEAIARKGVEGAKNEV